MKLIILFLSEGSQRAFDVFLPPVGLCVPFLPPEEHLLAFFCHRCSGGATRLVFCHRRRYSPRFLPPAALRASFSATGGAPRGFFCHQRRFAPRFLPPAALCAAYFCHRRPFGPLFLPPGRCSVAASQALKKTMG